jgi:arylsulfatase A-like enzyme
LAGKVKPAVFEALVSHIDLFASLAELVGVAIPEGTRLIATIT